MECEAAKTNHCEGQSASVLKELQTLCEDSSTSDELPSYAFVISAMLFMLIMAEIVMILFAIWIKYIEDKWWEEQTNRPKNNINT
uniref:Ovule protein n=1 Tax=Parascaris univalens TaxID=6257 RepID=A0A914ZNL8_PARUN